MSGRDSNPGPTGHKTLNTICKRNQDARNVVGQGTLFLNTSFNNHNLLTFIYNNYSFIYFLIEVLGWQCCLFLLFKFYDLGRGREGGS